MSPKSSALMLLVLAAIAGAGLPAVSQQGPAPRSSELQPGKILAVQPHEEGRAFDWVTRSAIPIYDHYPFYDLTIRSGDKIYIVRYESQTSYYPSAWKPGSTIQVRPEHGRLYLLRYDGVEVPAGILRTSSDHH
jgi:hypothetical protein